MNMIKFSDLFSSYLFSILFSTIYFLGLLGGVGGGGDHIMKLES